MSLLLNISEELIPLQIDIVNILILENLGVTRPLFCLFVLFACLFV